MFMTLDTLLELEQDPVAFCEKHENLDRDYKGSLTGLEGICDSNLAKFHPDRCPSVSNDLTSKRTPAVERCKVKAARSLELFNQQKKEIPICVTNYRLTDKDVNVRCPAYYCSTD